MPTSATGNDPRPRGGLNASAGPRLTGFTLVELLVVLLLIGLVASLAVLALRSESPTERLQREAERLHARMDLAREEAVLQARSLGLEVAPGGYRFLELAEDGWRGLRHDRLLAEHELPEGTRLRAKLEGIEIVLDGAEEEADAATGETDRDRPQIFFLVSGEILPDFTLTLSGREADAEFIIAPGDREWLELSEQAE